MANENRDGTWWTFSRLMPWLLLAVAAALARVCIVAEEAWKWYRAQAALIGILFLLTLMGVDWWSKHVKKRWVPPELRTLYQALQCILLAFAIGIIAVLIVAVGTDRWVDGIVAKSAGKGILFAGATFAMGMLLGFLFGFPPAPNSSAPQAAGQTGGAVLQGQALQAGSVTAAPRSESVFENTNLREISDWLTKVIVGAGLVDLTKLPPQVRKLAQYMAEMPPYGNSEPGGSAAVALAILGYFSSLGVLFGYVWTRFEFLSTSCLADRDAEALQRVDRWLKQPPGPNVDSELAAMTKAIKGASAGAQMRILQNAQQYRSAGTEDAIARSLAVFQALVEGDPHEALHRIRGQYALALMARTKDAAAENADWKRALDLLNDAIRIREQSHEPNWHEYEFARAVCRIHLDEQFNQQQKSTPEAQSSIRADLDKFSDVPDAQKRIIDPDDPTTKEGVAKTWIELNP